MIVSFTTFCKQNNGCFVQSLFVHLKFHILLFHKCFHLLKPGKSAFVLVTRWQETWVSWSIHGRIETHNRKIFPNIEKLFQNSSQPWLPILYTCHSVSTVKEKNYAKLITMCQSHLAVSNFSMNFLGYSWCFCRPTKRIYIQTDHKSHTQKGREPCILIKIYLNASLFPYTLLSGVCNEIDVPLHVNWLYFGCK